MQNIIIPGAAGKPLFAEERADGGVNVFNSMQVLVAAFRPSYVFECGGALAALDDFYRLEDGSRFYGPARLA